MWFSFVSVHRWTTMRLAITFMALLSCCAGRATAGEWKWTSEDVARGVSASIALDGTQNVHVAFLTVDAQLYYGFRPAQVDKWFTVEVLHSTHVTQNTYPRVAVDDHGKPHLCVAIGTLKYITLQNSRWTAQDIDPGSGTISYHCSIATGPDGAPHLSWYHEFLPGGRQFTHVRHADLENGAWIVRSIEGGIAGKWNSLVIDPKGFAHISYSQWVSGGDLKYASWDGQGWNIESVDSSHNSSTYRGYDNSLALDKNGGPHISYLDETTLKYAYKKDNKWVIEVVGSVAPGYDFYRGSTTMLLDSHGTPHIVYGDVGGVKHAFWDGKKWQIQTIVTGGVEQYGSVDAAMGPNDTLYVAYPDPEDGIVKLMMGKAAPETQAAAK